MNYKINKDQLVTSEEINSLRLSVGWDAGGVDYDKIMKQSYTHYTVYTEQKLIAFLNVISDGVGDALLVDIMVHPDFRNQGVGSGLVKQAVQDLSDDGIQCIQVVFNPEDEAFYKNIGFHILKAGIIDNKSLQMPQPFN